MALDVGFLSGQNWASKSFSAILWSKTTEPEPVGYRLAADADARVRRVLALHLVQSQADEDADTLFVPPSGASAAAKRRDARTNAPRVPTRGPMLQRPCSSHGSYANRVNSREQLTVLPGRARLRAGRGS